MSDGPVVPTLPALGGLRESLDTTFRATSGETGTVDLILVTIDERQRTGWESFSLIFAGPDESLPQGTYSVTHDALGSFDLFLVPVLVEGAGVRYEAVFNRPPS